MDYCHGNNPIYADGKVIGRATGGNFGFRVNKSLAVAMVNPAHSEVGTKLKIDILGDMYDVTVIPESPYDPDRMDFQVLPLHHTYLPKYRSLTLYLLLNELD